MNGQEEAFVVSPSVPHDPFLLSRQSMKNVPGKGNRLAQYERRYAERRHWLDSIKIAAGCKDCGCLGPAEVLTFDHVRGQKKFGVGSSWNQGKKALEEEIAKCEIVCANCHAKRTKSRNVDGPVFEAFPKIARLNRETLVTEKLDGTNGTVWVDGDLNVWAGSRNRWLPEGGSGEDNYGFAAWVSQHAGEFKELGPCLLRGEWWGRGIQRNYGLTEKRFSLFNVARWVSSGSAGVIDVETGLSLPCCHVVPTLWRGDFSSFHGFGLLSTLREGGSVAAPGFMKPEGIVIYHTAANQCFKATLEGDEKPKGLAEPVTSEQLILGKPAADEVFRQKCAKDSTKSVICFNQLFEEKPKN